MGGCRKLHNAVLHSLFSFWRGVRYLSPPEILGVIKEGNNILIPKITII
jgi:hypothetical protein